MRSRTPPSINAGSMADIAFLLLIFFLVSTSIENPRGLQVILPPYVPTPPTQLHEDKVLTVKLNRENLVLLEDEIMLVTDLSQSIKTHVQERLSIGQQPIISFVTDTSALYASYIQVYDEIKSAYSELREQSSQVQYGKSYKYLDRSKRLAINKAIPMIISEADYY